jgi:NMD protein affecting ribosome stability and mRNA decay
MPSGDVKHYGEHNLGAERSDPYQAKGKYREPAQCSDCGAVFHRGRWAWGTAGADAEKALCPACRRIREKLPAGTIELRGPFSVEHRQDLLRLVRNEAEREGKEHPLHRLMQVEEGADRVDITTTDIHLPRRIGEALKRAYDGELDIKHGADEYTVRVHWYR